MGADFIAYLVGKNINNVWEAVGPYNKYGELQPIMNCRGYIKDIFSDRGCGEAPKFDSYRHIDFNQEKYSEDLREAAGFGGTDDDLFDPEQTYKWTSLAAIASYINKYPTIDVYNEDSDELYRTIENPVKELYILATGIAEIMGFYIFDDLDLENFRIVYAVLY